MPISQEHASNFNRGIIFWRIARCSALPELSKRAVKRQAPWLNRPTTKDEFEAMVTCSFREASRMAMKNGELG